MGDQRRSAWAGAAIGLVVTIPLAALLYLGQQVAGLPMAAFDLLERLTRIQQLGSVVTVGIETMVHFFASIPGLAIADAAKTSERLMAVGLFVILGAILGAVIALLYPRFRANSSMIVGIAALVLSLALEISGSTGPQQLAFVVIWFGILYLSWARAIGWALDRVSASQAAAPETATPQGAAPLAGVAEAPQPTDPERRRFLLQFGASAAALTLAAWGVGSLFGRRTSDLAGQPIAAATPAVPPSSGGTTGSQAAATEPAGAFVAVKGTRPEVTDNKDFYRVDIEIAGPPGIDEKTYNLNVGGLVNKPLKLSYDDIRKMTPVDQSVTLECISNPVGGDLISSTRWTGVRLRDVLNQAGLKDGVVEIKFTCADGYSESLPLDSAMDERTLLVYGMNGAALLVEHGFPLRLYVPNRYGMKNPKWITGIEAVNQPYNGYWEVRGWDKQAIIKTTSVIDSIASDQAQNGIVPVGGVAFAGARGISKVEVSVDGGPWQEAQIKDAISPLTWRLWRFDWKAPKGSHTLQVRATDGEGQLQSTDIADTQPNGASGYFSAQVSI